MAAYPLDSWDPPLAVFKNLGPGVCRLGHVDVLPW